MDGNQSFDKVILVKNSLEVAVTKFFKILKFFRICTNYINSYRINVTKKKTESSVIKEFTLELQKQKELARLRNYLQYMNHQQKMIVFD